MSKTHTTELQNMMLNFKHMMNAPAVVKLKKRVSDLKKQVSILNRVILHLGKSLDDDGNKKRNLQHKNNSPKAPCDIETSSSFTSDENEGICYNIVDDYMIHTVSN